MFCDLRLTDCLFRGNTAHENAGAILAWFDGQVTVERCTFEGNTATVGGAICVAEKAEVRVSNSVFAGNISAQGGALATRRLNNTTDTDAPAVLKAWNNTFIANETTSGTGAAVFLDTMDSSVLVNQYCPV